MAKDYVVDEVRRVREEQAAKYSFDVNAILAAARERQRRSGRFWVPALLVTHYITFVLLCKYWTSDSQQGADSNPPTVSR